MSRTTVWTRFQLEIHWQTSQRGEGCGGMEKIQRDDELVGSCIWTKIGTHNKTADVCVPIPWSVYLQIGWLTLSPPNKSYKQQVILGGRWNGVSCKCALYIDSNDQQWHMYLTKEFNTDPYLFLTNDFFLYRTSWLEIIWWGNNFFIWNKWKVPPIKTLPTFWVKWRMKYPRQVGRW